MCCCWCFGGQDVQRQLAPCGADWQQPGAVPPAGGDTGTARSWWGVLAEAAAVVGHRKMMDTLQGADRTTVGAGPTTAVTRGSAGTGVMTSYVGGGGEEGGGGRSGGRAESSRPDQAGTKARAECLLGECLRVCEMLERAKKKKERRGRRKHASGLWR